MAPRSFTTPRRKRQDWAAAPEAAGLRLRTGPVGFDGRADVVPLGRADRTGLSRLRTAEDLFADVVVLRRRATASATAAALDRRTLQAGLEHLRRLGGRVDTRSLRVVIRVLDERHYNRTTLREAVTRRLRALLPSWRAAPDPSAVELWVLQIGPAAYRFGFRLRGLGSRSHPARAVERQGALRPAAAAAMVHLAGPPRGVLLDPCCGTGTILTEAGAAGWSATGGDIDEAAVSGAAVNTGAAVVVLDARRLPFSDDAAQALGRLPLELRARHDIVLLGEAAMIWSLERRDT